ncbi:Alpha/Beta hydrolase protein [Polychytrium aggregatum]|uniref:Alpha/Beta hydrolase protein n=1 Tax=Polychytrium aggregatum TaxID=110093 RepID=UPI0022FEB1A5|nr:Alpha/Beta hydrolase protein [Polychytrium aggregatum]KAI9197489.1 Alpha/Beta hydrolase protein [Polychytrium aggregatum]
MTSSSASVTIDTKWFQASDGTSIFTRTWIPSTEPKIVLCHLHGLGEHSGRYTPIFTQYAQHGIKSYSFDQRGFGETGRKSGTLGYNDGIKRVYADVDELLARVKSEHPELPIVLSGQSMGGGLALGYVVSKVTQSKPVDLAGIIAMSPFILLPKETAPDPFTYWGGRILAPIVPSLPIKKVLDIRSISRVESVRVDYLNDPLNHQYISVGTGNDILSNGDNLHKSGYQHLHIPLCMAHGEADIITSAPATKDFFEKAPSQTKVIKLIPDAVHELHNDLCREDVIDFYTKFMLGLAAN